MGAALSSSKSPNYIHPAIQSSNPPTRVYRIEVYKICRLVKQLTEDERKLNGIKVIIKINPVKGRPHSTSIDMPYPPSVYQKNPSESRLRPMLLSTKTSITSFPRSMSKSDIKTQPIISDPHQPLEIVGLKKVKYIPTSYINTFHFDKHYNVRDILTAIDATINEVCSPTPTECTVTQGKNTAASSVISTPIRLIQRPLTVKGPFILPESDTNNGVDTGSLARTSAETVTNAISIPKAASYMDVKTEVSPATTTISFRDTLTSEADSNSIMETTISEPATVIFTPEAPKLNKMQIASTSSDSILDITFGSLNFPMPTIANSDISGTSYIKILKNADTVFSPEKIKTSTANTIPPLNTSTSVSKDDGFQITHRLRPIFYWRHMPEYYDAPQHSQGTSYGWQ
ncbi:hypothetical protein CNBC0960 [Cryptococcus deneoformans B-3501A]|uniref:hypothetical protein n=1 Tax=Cryptococcus deneoformans (strain B-3501A) TaxID=283643 RepID=UPI000042DE13|nr:hypothetical protein CNBC0960 [Cryptococcus neoformans var. neoformans B-3501A]EAL21956.1 hypothetical protein CNBC0960 [Cryptococcus neoformans var. neoformans B-3501A]